MSLIVMQIDSSQLFNVLYHFQHKVFVPDEQRPTNHAGESPEFPPPGLAARRRRLDCRRVGCAGTHRGRLCSLDAGAPKAAVHTGAAADTSIAKYHRKRVPNPFLPRITTGTEAPCFQASEGFPQRIPASEKCEIC